MNERDADFTWFFRSQYPLVARTVFLVLRDAERSDDIAQDAFLALFARWKRISRYERPELWVRRVAIRMAVRASGRERSRAQRERDAVTAIPQAGVGSADPDLLRAMLSLPRAQRVAIVLFYFEDRPAAEIGTILGCAESTARVHLSRARRRLAELLDDHEEETSDAT